MQGVRARAPRAVRRAAETPFHHTRARTALASIVSPATYPADGRLSDEEDAQGWRHRPRHWRARAVSPHAARRRAAARLAVFLDRGKDRAFDRPRPRHRGPVMGTDRQARPVAPLVSGA